MKKATITLSYDEEKLSALRLYLEQKGGTLEEELQQAVERIQQETRRYAKRQLTWMRREEDVLWVDALEPDAYDKLEAYYTQGEAK